MQKARRHPTKGLRPLVGARFQGLFTPLLGVLFTFPSRYLFTIGLSGVFSLTGWCRQIQREFHRLPPTQDTHLSSRFPVRDFHPVSCSFPSASSLLDSIIWVLQPQSCRNNFGLGFSAFARHYLRNHYYFLFLRVLRCFSSPGLLPSVDGCLVFN